MTSKGIDIANLTVKLNDFMMNYGPNGIYVALLLKEGIHSSHSTGYHPKDSTIGTIVNFNLLGKNAEIFVDNTIIRWIFTKEDKETGEKFDIKMAYKRALVIVNHDGIQIEKIAHISIHEGTPENIELSKKNAKQNKAHCNEEQWKVMGFTTPNYKKIEGIFTYHVLESRTNKYLPNVTKEIIIDKLDLTPQEKQYLLNLC